MRDTMEHEVNPNAMERWLNSTENLGFFLFFKNQLGEAGRAANFQLIVTACMLVPPVYY